METNSFKSWISNFKCSGEWYKYYSDSKENFNRLLNKQKYLHKKPNNPSNNILFFHMKNVKMTITAHALYSIVRNYGSIKNIIVYRKKFKWKALIEFANEEDAIKAKCSLQHDRFYYFSLSIEYAKVSCLEIPKNDLYSWNYEPLSFSSHFSASPMKLKNFPEEYSATISKLKSEEITEATSSRQKSPEETSLKRGSSEITSSKLQSQENSLKQKSPKESLSKQNLLIQYSTNQTFPENNVSKQMSCEKYIPKPNSSDQYSSEQKPIEDNLSKQILLIENSSKLKTPEDYSLKEYSTEQEVPEENISKPNSPDENVLKKSPSHVYLSEKKFLKEN